jgi:hypothetical protein
MSASNIPSSAKVTGDFDLEREEEDEEEEEEIGRPMVGTAVDEVPCGCVTEAEVEEEVGDDDEEEEGVNFC